MIMMRRSIYCTLLVLVFTCSLKAQEIVNPSFSILDSSAGIVAKGWTKTTNRIFYDTINAHTAPGCIYIYNNDYFESVCKQVIPFRPGKYKKFKLTLFIRTESRKGYAGAYVKGMDNAGHMIYKNAMPDGKITGKKRWQLYEVEFYVTADVTQLELGFYFYDKGKAWFDDISIEALPDSPQKPASKVAKKYLGEVCKIIDKQGWYRDSVDLDQAYKNALELIPDAKTTSDCYEGVAYIMDRLGDKQGKFYDPATAKNWLKEEKINDERPLYPAVRMQDSYYVHINLPGVTAMSKTVDTNYADTLHQQLAALDQKSIKGWILDLRENVGGNATAMLAAVGPLLEIEVCGKYIRRKETVDWKYKDGKAKIDTTVIKVNMPYVAPKPELPLTILTSDGTYGAGELVFVALKNREKTKSFGERTAGATYNEKRITLSDGAMLFFTAGIMSDTKGQRYDGRISPDSHIRLIYKEDVCLIKALKWLKEQP